MVVNEIKDFLDSHQVKYQTIEHAPAFTAQEVAESAHLAGKSVAKTVILKVDGKMAMGVLPAPDKINLDLFRKATGAKGLELAREEEFRELFPHCEIGAMPPLGNLYGLDVFVSSRLAEDEKIAFNAGTHTDLIQMSYSDYENLVHPVRVVLN